MAKLFHRLGTSYSAGIDLRSAYQRETETGSPAYRIKAKKVAAGVGKGMELADAMASTDGYFPDLAISVVKAGERGGRLEESFGRLSKHYGDLVSFRNKFLSAIAWPAFELVAAFFIVGGLMAICDWIFDSMGMEKLNWLWMGSTVGNVIAYFVLVILFFTGLAVLIVGTARGWFGTLPMRIAMKIPLIGKTIECMALSRFAWTLSVAENAGMNPVETAQLALRATENFYYKRLEPQVCRALQGGQQFYKTFKATEAFPEDILIYIDNGETAGELAESMDRASQELQERAESNLKVLGTIGFAAMITIVGLVVLIICVFAMQQYINMINSIGDFR
ncbi:MAG: type II secretion system F family protein [Mariniblastus sp.]